MTARIVLAALCLGVISSAAGAAPLLDGPVYGGAFGMSGSDYYGEIRERPPGAAQPAGKSALRRHHGVRPGARPRVGRAATAGAAR